MFTNYHILDFFNYICAQNVQSRARITESDMEIQRHNRLKATIEQVQKMYIENEVNLCSYDGKRD